MWHDLGTEFYCRAARRALQALQDSWQYFKIKLPKASYMVSLPHHIWYIIYGKSGTCADGGQ